MNQSLSFPTSSVHALGDARLPLLRLLNPREQTRLVWLSLALGVLIGWLGVHYGLWKLWMATAVVLVALLPVAVRKWQADRVHYGGTIMLLSILLTTQGAHSVEHIVQWLQYHLFFWTARQSSGLISPANAEWVHFIWNWSVLLVVIVLVRGGMRNFWTWLLFSVALLHTVEHTYTFVRYLQVLSELGAMGVAGVTAQGLPGILGRDGWLARSVWTQGTIICSVPGLTTAVRLDVHFWWNVIEMSLLALGGHVFLRRQRGN
jgi:hypothetical protein